ncbi:nicotinate-nucleotide adenylyltransferase [Candidatus Cloacimonadota bacterium]
MKIGLLGGSFDPLHNGHIALAETAVRALSLEKVLFLPSGNHPLKKEKTILPAEKRYELTQKALLNYPNFEASRQDMKHDGFSYSSELIKRLKEIYPEDEFFFITGDDIIAELPKWHEWKWLLQNVQFVVAERPDTDRYKWQNLDYLEHFIFINMKPHDISSTAIRRRVKQKLDISNLVPEAILSEVNSLY